MIKIDDNITVKISNKIYDEFEKYLNQRANGKNSKYYSTGIHVSSLDDCVRKVVMEYYNFEKKPRSLEDLLMFEIANFVHDLMGKAISASDKFELLAKERKLSQHLPDKISGKCDLIYRDIENDIVILSDTKTAHTNKFERFSDSMLMDSHRIQINMYKMGATYHHKIKNPDMLLMTYFDRGGQHKPIFVSVAEIAETKLKEICSRYASAVNEYERTKSIPPLHPLSFTRNTKSEVLASRPWNCDYCQFCYISCQSWGAKFPSTKPKTKVNIGIEDMNGRLVVSMEFMPIADSLMRMYANHKKGSEI